MFGRRPDGTQVREISTMRRFMPFISPRRNESLVYFAQDLKVDRALAFLEERNAHRPDDARMTLFHLVIRAIAQGLTERPRLNRFTAGGRLYQRDGVWITFSAKKWLADDAPMSTVKRRLDADMPLDEFVDVLLGGIREGKSEKKSTSDKEMGLALRMPGPVIRLAMWALRKADAFGLLPKAMIDSDPLFTSAFVANLGSVGLEAGYHHLWEHGNCPIFCVVGKVKDGPAGGRIMTLKWSYDERVDDGLYAAGSLEIVRERIENPEKL